MMRRTKLPRQGRLPRVIHNVSAFPYIDAGEQTDTEPESIDEGVRCGLTSDLHNFSHVPIIIPCSSPWTPLRGVFLQPTVPSHHKSVLPPFTLLLPSCPATVPDLSTKEEAVRPCEYPTTGLAWVSLGRYSK